MERVKRPLGGGERHDISLLTDGLRPDRRANELRLPWRLANPSHYGTESMSDFLPAIELQTGPQPEYTVIWLHGLGADGNDFAPIVPELGLAPLPAVRFIFPHAPRMPITWNNGYVMPAWYDIVSLEEGRRHADEGGIRQSREAIRKLIARENERGVPTHRIVLAGFSQGGAMAYVAGLTHPEPLAGIVALSTYIPSPELLAAEQSDANRKTPVFAAHGTDDPVVPLELGVAARDALIASDYPVEWHSYRMPHSVCPQEINDIGAWLRTRLA